MTAWLAARSLQRALSFPAKAGNPVRRGVSDESSRYLEYWIARSSRAMTAWVWLAGTASRSRGLSRPSFVSSLRLKPSIERGRREDREPAGTRGHPCGWHRRRGCTAAYRCSRDIPAFPAQWLDGLCRALPGERCTLAPVALQPCSTRRPGWTSRITATAWRQQPDARTTRFCRTPVSSLVVREGPAHGSAALQDQRSRR